LSSRDPQTTPSLRPPWLRRRRIFYPKLTIRARGRTQVHERRISSPHLRCRFHAKCPPPQFRPQHGNPCGNRRSASGSALKRTVQATTARSTFARSPEYIGGGQGPAPDDRILNERAASVGGLKSALKTRGDTIQSGAPFTACWDSARRSAGTRRAVTTSAAALKPPPRVYVPCCQGRLQCGQLPAAAYDGAMDVRELGERPPGRTPASWLSLANNNPRAPAPFFPDAL